MTKNCGDGTMISGGQNNNIIHPRRLFAMPEDDPDVAYMKPASITKQGEVGGSFFPPATTPKRTAAVHGLPLLAPSPTSGIYIEASQLVSDVETLCEYMKNLGENFSDGFLGSNGKSVSTTAPSIVTKQLGPLRDAIVQLQTRIYEQSTMAIITPLLTPPEPSTPAAIASCSQSERGEEEDEKSAPLVASPIKSAVVTDEQPPSREVSMSTSLSRVLDSRILSLDLEHLRTIQKEVRGLFRSSDEIGDHVSVRSPSPISTRRGGSMVLQSTCTSQTTDGAGKISRLLTDSEEVKKQQSLIDAGLSQLTLSPATELFERDSIRKNPWFISDRENRQVVVPPQSPVVRGRDVRGAGVAAALNMAMGQSRTGARSSSRRRSLSASAPVARQEQKASDLISWLKKQAANASPGYSGGSAKKLASIYTSRHRGDSVKHLN